MRAKVNKENALVKLESAGVLKGDKWLIRDIDLSVCPGEIVTLIGPNGSGKSTTVKTALGLIRPNEGRASRKRGLTIGYMPQKLFIDETLPLTVGRLMCLTQSHSAEVIHEALATVNALDLINRRVQALSGGEFQRVLLARAIAGKPDLLVLDEPAQGVDFANEAALYDLIVKYRDDTGSGVLLISHDLHIVMAQTDKVLCLNGHVCCTGTPK
ncbi:MAG: metal ABC transporter ATP-binding protein, partial [Methylocystaceae bacterium]|nr:metal ABC transporter ATP-binding protein [Methylocystaceae bacterium]